MSRCFPYPPPGYVRNGARGGDALIESIEREREKAKSKQRKERKREKKEKRKERKEKEKNKIRETNDEKVRQLSDEKSRQGGKRKDENEHLEKSGLTEEHEQPICSLNLCYLSDGTQSSKKRKMLSSPSNGSQKHGNIIRIRLSLRKHKEPNVSLSGEQLCSTSGREEPLVRQREDVHITCQEQYSLTVEPNKEVQEIFTQNVAEAAFGTSLYEDEMKRAKSQYKALIEDWVPRLPQYERNDYDDQEWLFGTKQQKHQERHRCKRLKAGNDCSSHASATLWPRAQYLPDADIYALPYTIPF